MPQHPVFEIEQKIRSYVGREATLDQLQEWFASAKGPLLELSGDLPAARLAGLLQLAFIETKDGILTERQLRRLLRGEMATTRVVLEGNPELTLSGSTTTSDVRVVDSAPQQTFSVLHRKQVDISA